MAGDYQVPLQAHIGLTCPMASSMFTRPIICAVFMAWKKWNYPAASVSMYVVVQSRQDHGCQAATPTKPSATERFVNVDLG